MLKNAFGLAFNRLELASLEFGEARNHFLKLLLVAAVGIFGGMFAVAWWSVLVVYLSWDSLGWKILLLMALGFSLLTFVIYRKVQHMLADDKLDMPLTMNELRHDRDALFAANEKSKS